MNVASKKISVDTQSEMRECHIFIAITNKVRSNKMIAIRRRTFIIKVQTVDKVKFVNSL